MEKERDIVTEELTKLVLKAKEKAYEETSNEPEPELTQRLDWPIKCTVGPGLEGAIACESEIGYVNGSKGMLIYRGYDIFDLCAYCTFEEVSYLLLHGQLPTLEELEAYKKKLMKYRYLIDTERHLMSFPIEEMNTMSALRLGVDLMRQKQTYRDRAIPGTLAPSIATDEDSIPMETKPMGESKPIYEFHMRPFVKPKYREADLLSAEGIESCYHLIAGVATIAGVIARLRKRHLPLEPDSNLSHAGNLLYVMTGERPTALEERIMDICLILHADHGMNASTFAALVVASTLSDVYFSVGSGIAALNGPLHGGANEQVMHMLEEIGDVSSVKPWYEDALRNKRKIMGFGHRVYKAYDPRARVLAPLASLLSDKDPRIKGSFEIAHALEKEVVSTIGKEKKIFPNVDFYSGIIYRAMGISPEMYTPVFAVARVVGWTSRVLEYLSHNRIFRPRSIYIGPFNREFVSIEQRRRSSS